MTTRPGKWAEELLRYERGKRLAHMVRVVAFDGSTLLMTDHDRQVTFESGTYRPVTFGAMSADRREGALRTGNQEFRGVMDGTVITLPDLEGRKYRFADVFIAVVDWRNPLIVYSRHRRAVASINWNGSSFVATFESITQRMQRPTGGRFGGRFTSACQYELGDQGTCKKNIASDVVTGAVVDTVPDDRMTVRFTTGSFTLTRADDYYRDGSIVWTSGSNTGLVSPIVGYTHSTRECRLLIPTEFAMEAGDEGTVKPGCDGLFSTCKTKYSNEGNFGGDNLAPTGPEIREPVTYE